LQKFPSRKNIPGKIEQVAFIRVYPHTDRFQEATNLDQFVVWLSTWEAVGEIRRLFLTSISDLN
jgi:hypothetical protein